MEHLQPCTLHKYRVVWALELEGDDPKVLAAEAEKLFLEHRSVRVLGIVDENGGEVDLFIPEGENGWRLDSSSAEKK